MKRLLLFLLVRVLRAFSRRAPRGLPPRPVILLPGYAGLGNFLMMTPLFAALKREFPEGRILLVAGNPWGAEHVLAGTKLVDRTIVVSDAASTARQLRTFLRLRRERPDVVFLPGNASPPFVWLGALLTGAPIRVGHTFDALGRDMRWTRCVLTHEAPLRLGVHESDLGLDLLDALLKRPAPRDPKTVIHQAPRDGTLAKFGLAERGYLVLQVSAANAQITPKRWPLENFARLVEALHAEGERIVLLGDRHDRAITNQFLAACPVEATDLTGRTTIPEAAAILAGARALVCHDSGLMHIGDAVGVPLVALFGPTDLAVTGPRAATSRVLRNDALPCIGCMKDYGKTEAEALRDCRRDLECMRTIPVEQVLALLREIRRGNRAAANAKAE